MLPPGLSADLLSAGRAGGDAADPSRRADGRAGAPRRMLLRPRDAATRRGQRGRGAAPRALPHAGLQPGAHHPRARRASPRARAARAAGRPLAAGLRRLRGGACPERRPDRLLSAFQPRRTAHGRRAGLREGCRRPRCGRRPAPGSPRTCRSSWSGTSSRESRAAPPPGPAAPLSRLRRRARAAVVVPARAQLPQLRAPVRAGRRRATGSAPTCSTSSPRNCSSPRSAWRWWWPPGRAALER